MATKTKQKLRAVRLQLSANHARFMVETSKAKPSATKMRILNSQMKRYQLKVDKLWSKLIKENS